MSALAQRTLSAARFYGATVLELGKEVARRQQLAPPALDAWPAARQELGAAWKKVRATNVGDYTPVQLGRGVLLAVEVTGFFVVGEMIGRRQIVGYKH